MLVRLNRLNVWYSGSRNWPFMGAFPGEFIARRDLRQGCQARLGASGGSIIRTALKIVVSPILR